MFKILNVFMQKGKKSNPIAYFSLFLALLSWLPEVFLLTERFIEFGSDEAAWGLLAILTMVAYPLMIAAIVLGAVSLVYSMLERASGQYTSVASIIVVVVHVVYLYR